MSPLSTPATADVPYYQCKAGRMQMQGSQLVADPRKGLLRVTKDATEAVHVTWQERSESPSSSLELDVSGAASTVVFSKVRATPPILQLRISSGAHNISEFFWLQDATMREPTGVDATIIFLDLIVQRPYSSAPDNLAPSSKAPQARGGHQEPASTPANQMPSIAPAAPPDHAAAAQLAAILSSIGAAQSGSQPASQDSQALAAMLSQAYRQQQTPEAGPSLTQILKQETLALLLPSISSPEQIAELVQHLPAEHQHLPGNPIEQLRQALQSPAFGSQLECISGLLQTGQLTLTEMGLPGEGSSAVDMLLAIQAQADEADQNDFAPAGSKSD